MARGAWTRWGQGDCVGYDLTIGYGPLMFGANVVRSIRTANNDARTWRASVNGSTIADGLPDKDTAMTKVEFELGIAMQHVIGDWEIFMATRDLKQNSRR
jgi:hypothetical protein